MSKNSGLKGESRLGLCRRRKAAREGGAGSWPPELERRNSAQLRTGRSQRKRFLVWVTVEAGSEEGRPAGQEPSAKGLSGGGGMTYQGQNLGHRKFCFFSFLTAQELREDYLGEWEGRM